MIASANVRGAAEVVKTANALANVCGKICPEEIYCQSVCNRGKQDSPINIRELHFFATQCEARSGYGTVTKFRAVKKRVAVVGGGPTGLSCAFELSKLGYGVTLFDKKGIGGVPKSSIPSFRLTPQELKDDLQFLQDYFVTERTHLDATRFSKVRKQFDAVYLGIGLGKDRPLGIEGEQLKGVVPVLEFLESVKRSRKPVTPGRRVVVIGGGNVSLDAAATAKRLGAREVTLVYRRSEREMKVWKSELEEARRQGIEFRFLANPVEMIGTTRVRGIRCRRTMLSKKKDGSGRPMPVEIKGSEFVLDADMVIVAIGQSIASDIVTQLTRDGRGFIAVDKNYQTSLPGVFAGGDAIAGEGTIVQSVAHGKLSAHAIHEYLEKGRS